MYRILTRIVHISSYHYSILIASLIVRGSYVGYVRTSVCSYIRAHRGIQFVGMCVLAVNPCHDASKAARQPASSVCYVMTGRRSLWLAV